ncbi:MAG: DNA repair protein RecO [Dehalococcoidia bacterium]
MLAHSQNLDIVTQSQAINGFLPMRDDLAKLSSGLYVAELVDRFTEEREASYPLFRLLVEALERIARGDQVSVALRYFEMGLLTISGYAPQLRACVVCGGGLRPVVNAFSPSAGGAVCADCNPAQSALRRLSVNGIKVMRLMQQAPFADVARIRLGHDLAVEIEDHLRAVLRVHAERDLRSLQFLHRVGRESNASGNAAAVVS